MMHQLFIKKTQRPLGLAFALLVLLLGVASCAGDEEAPARQAPPVTVAKPVVEPVSDFAIFTGSSRAFETTDVVARVTGYLVTVEFKASSMVQAGDLLFTIEDERYLAARDVARAAVESAKADLLRSETELLRVEKASQSKAVSEMDVDRAKADRDMSVAAVASAEARLSDAELDLSYTRVVSPIDGFVSRNLVDRGNCFKSAVLHHGYPALMVAVDNDLRSLNGCAVIGLLKSDMPVAGGCVNSLGPEVGEVFLQSEQSVGVF